jgi:hypothetical protein
MNNSIATTNDDREAAKQRASDRMYAKLARFDRLPDDAVVDDHVAAAVLNMSVDTLRRNNPVPQRRLSDRRMGRRVGDLRKFIQQSAA